ncbi:MAG: AAA family ATPase [Prevotella sp.]|nr:AAA family ATPase [Candidatus Prevotella equi]
MTTTEFKQMIVQRFGFTPTADQQGALNVFASFLACRESMPAMILRGSAGTGKTSLVSAMVQTLVGLKQKVVLLAPTGRAAKVLSLNSNMPAATIHRKIYRQKSVIGDFNLDVNLHTDTLFVVDEASMISTEPQIEREGMPMFRGNGGGVIDDLVTYVYSGRNCRLMLIGDTAQLPPVGEEEAPALRAFTMECYGLKVFECDLNEVLRQGKTSGILWNATMIRHLITHDEATQLPQISFNGFADIRIMPGNEIIESLEDSYHRVGIDDTIVITRSNKTATIYNNGIRARVLDHEDMLSSGDRLMIVKNHYLDEDTGLGLFIANGDVALVRKVRSMREMYGFTFADLTLQFPDYDDHEMQLTAILDTLQTEAPALTTEQQQRLYEGVMEDYMHIPRKEDRMREFRKDTYYTALQVKFAYAVTCHKAQGGQWSHVYVDQGYMTDDMLTPDYIHWLYTAFTRATDTLFLINWPKEQINKLAN